MKEAPTTNAQLTSWRHAPDRDFGFDLVLDYYDYDWGSGDVEFDYDADRDCCDDDGFHFLAFRPYCNSTIDFFHCLKMSFLMNCYYYCYCHFRWYGY